VSRLAQLGSLIGSVLLAGGLAAGCTNTSAGQPLPTSGGATSGGTETTTLPPGSSTSRPAAPRPREIRLNGKDPCVLVVQADWSKFHIDKPGKAGMEPTFNSPDCFYSNNAGSFSVTLVVTEGVGKWTDGSRSGVAVQVAPLEGFPAIAITRKGDEYQCGVAVDVAEGQYLLATVVVRPSTASQLPERCEYAHQLAESAMRTLVGGG
jgi:hypothetical protein